MRVQDDPATRLADWLAPNVTAADVVTFIPDDWTFTGRPLIVISDDGGPVADGVYSRHTIRVTARHQAPADARRAAVDTVARLHTAKLSGLVILKSSGGVIAARDPKTADHLASALMTVLAKTVEV